METGYRQGIHQRKRRAEGRPGEECGAGSFTLKSSVAPPPALRPKSTEMREVGC
ncbi:hypothetical protein LY78DRAFT_360485 [Colletotrichum sublineola]|nr:hypothetical protein LY78DRAFT_360485 [Colletotrichum sublineola]